MKGAAASALLAWNAVAFGAWQGSWGAGFWMLGIQFLAMMFAAAPWDEIREKLRG